MTETRLAAENLLARLTLLDIRGLGVRDQDGGSLVRGRYRDGQFLIFHWPTKQGRLNCVQAVIIPDRPSHGRDYHIVGHWTRYDEPEGATVTDIVGSVWRKLVADDVENHERWGISWVVQAWKSLPMVMSFGEGEDIPDEPRPEGLGDIEDLFGC